MTIREHTRVVAKSREAEERAEKLEEELREVAILIVSIAVIIIVIIIVNTNTIIDVITIRLETQQSCLNSECLSWKAEKAGRELRSL